LKAVLTREFFFWNTASGTRNTTKSMADYKTIQNVLSQKGLPFFTFYIKGDKPVKAVIRHLPNYTLSEDITVALQKLGYKVTSRCRRNALLQKEGSLLYPFPSSLSLW
jgi:hypothetical protein